MKTYVCRSDKIQFYKQVQRDTLWSDPKDSLGNDYNSRGAGVAFGPDIAKLFLNNNNLKMVIRSHECVRSGFDKPYAEWPEYENILCTIFSASNYGGSGNTSAYIEIVLQDHISVRSMASSMIQRVADTDLVYTVHYFHVDSSSPMMDSSFYVDAGDDNSSMIATQDEDDANTVIDVEILASKSVGLNSVAGEEIVIFPSLSPKQTDLTNGRHSTLSPTSQAAADAEQQALNASPLSIPEQIFRKKMVLLDAFHAADIDRDGIIPTSTWSDVMQHILKLKIQWISLLPVLIQLTSPPPSTTSQMTRGGGAIGGQVSCLSEDEDHQQTINYFQFLNGFTSPKAFQYDQSNGFGPESSALAAQQNLDLNQAIVSALYVHYLQLEHTFQFFDVDKNGMITLSEFLAQCEVINASLPADYKLKELEQVFHLMDVKENGEIDINLFFEMFRLADNFANISDKLYTYSHQNSATGSPALTPRGASSSSTAMTPGNLTREIDSPASTQYLSLPNSPVRLENRLGPVVNFQRIVSVEENEHDDELVGPVTSNKRLSGKNPTVLDGRPVSPETTASSSQKQRMSLQNPNAISGELSPRNNSFDLDDDESIFVPAISTGSSSPGKSLSRHGSISGSSIPPAPPSPVSSPHRRLSYQAVGETVDINGIRISIDAATPKTQDKKDASNIVAIDI
jgi:hypothetical protein